MVARPARKRTASTECSVLVARSKKLRELIAVTPRTERILRSYARAHPENARSIKACLKFRSLLFQEFERLLREGAPFADLPEEEESESDATEESYAVAQA